MDSMIEALLNGQQCDEDGVMCIVPRQACHEAADEIMALRNALADKGKPYVGEDTVALVLYFGSREDADGFAAVIHEAKPGMIAKSVTV